MMKHMKKAISFVMAVCLLAGNSYVDTGAPVITMEPIVTQESTSFDEGETTILSELEGWKEDTVRKASAEDTTTGTGGTTTGGTTTGDTTTEGSGNAGGTTGSGENTGTGGTGSTVNTIHSGLATSLFIPMYM